MSKLSKAGRQRLFLQNNPGHFIFKEKDRRKALKEAKVFHNKEVKRVVQLRNEGLSIMRIIKKVDISRSMIYVILKKYVTE
jgi:hypothetical protein